MRAGDATGQHRQVADKALEVRVLGREMPEDPGDGPEQPAGGAGFRDAAWGPLQQALDQQGAESVGIERGGILFQGAGQDGGHALTPC